METLATKAYQGVFGTGAFEGTPFFWTYNPDTEKAYVALAIEDDGFETPTFDTILSLGNTVVETLGKEGWPIGVDSVHYLSPIPVEAIEEVIGFVPDYE